MIVLGPDPHRIARLEEAGGGLAVADRLDGADLGKARIAHPAVGDRLARPAIAIAVGNGVRAQDRPRAQPPRLGGMRDERAEIEGHVLARSEEHTSELQSLMRISYAVFCLKKKTHKQAKHTQTHNQQDKNKTA